MTDYVGIDYGMGHANIDVKTGIHYGVISQHSVIPEAMDDVDYDYGDPTCPECGRDLTDVATITESWADKPGDYACSNCQKVFWSDVCFSDEAIGWSYRKEGYKLTDCLDSDIFVLESPYYTHAQYCSPCVPGAGNLDTPVEDGPKTYCLGHDWFEDGKAPYTVYSVADGTIVQP